MSALTNSFSLTALRQTGISNCLTRGLVARATFFQPQLPRYRLYLRSMASVASVVGREPGGPNAASISPIARQYDPEIKDMADYIHNYKIESDLAVSRLPQI